MKIIGDLSIQMDYTFSSALGGPLEGGRYIKDAKATIYNGEFADNTHNEYAGEIEFKLLYLEQAIEDGRDIFEIFDHYEYTCRLGESLYNFKDADFKDAIYKHYDYNLFNGNLCIIETMMLLPSYRGYGLGGSLFKDLIFNFKSFSSLFVLHPFPLQFDSRAEDEAFNKKIGLNSFEKNKTKASKKLTAYYQSWGLEKIKGIKGLLFYNAEARNEKFDKIDLEE